MKLNLVSVFLHTNIVFLHINDFPIPIPYAYTSSCILIVDRFTYERHSYTKETIHLPRLARLLVNTDWFVQYSIMFSK